MSDTSLKEECVRSVGLEGRSGGLLYAAWQGELDVVVVHLLDEGPLAVLGGNGLNTQDLNVSWIFFRDIDIILVT